MIVSFNCTCGNNDPKKAKFYDGALGYEAIVCKVCGRVYDFDLEGKPRTNEADGWSRNFVGLKSEKKVTIGLKTPEKKPIDYIEKYDRFQVDGDGGAFDDFGTGLNS